MRDEFTFTISSRVPHDSHTRTKGKGNVRLLCDSYWRMISLQKCLVDSISNFCSVQQWSSSSFAFMCIVTSSILWEGLTTRLECMEHRSLVLFNHRHQKGSHLIPCKDFVDQNKQEAGGNVFESVKETIACTFEHLFLLTRVILLRAYETDFSIYQILLFFFGNTIACYIQLSNWHHYRQLSFLTAVY